MHKLADYALDKVNLGAIIIDKDLNIVMWNNWLVRLTGKSAEEMIGKNLLAIYPQFARKTYHDILHNALFDGKSRFCSGTLHKTFIPPEEGIQNDVRQNMFVEPLTDHDEQYALIQITDMTGHYTRVKQLKNMLKELGLEYEQAKASEVMSRHQAMHDVLTGLPNRSLFMDRLDNVLNLARRNEEMMAVMFLDLDGFKEINDTYGHDSGDLILQDLAERLKLFLRDSDTLARLGGDEFVLLLPRINNESDAATVATKIKDSYKQPFSISGQEVFLSLSIGISIYPGDGDNAQTLIKNADMAMYRAKSAGKNDFKFFRIGTNKHL